jgi:hypothetical protein
MAAQHEHAPGAEGRLDRHGVHQGGQVDQRDVGLSRAQPIKPFGPGDRVQEADVETASAKLAVGERRVQRRMQPGQSAGAVGGEGQLAH